MVVPPTTRDEILALGNVDAEFVTILQAFKWPEGGPPTDLASIRKMLDDGTTQALKAMGKEDCPADVVEEEVTIPTRDGSTIRATIHKPAHGSGGPLCVLFHGGGFIAGNRQSEALNARMFAQRYSAVTVNVEYRLAPEHVFPTSPNDCWDATKWAAANATSHGADPSKGFIVGGTSAGGNLADVIGHLARDEKLSPPVTGLLELIPSLVTGDVLPEKFRERFLSYEQNAQAPMLTADNIAFIQANYKPDPKSFLANPFIHPDGHKGMPPVFLQVCGMDPLRDGALIYESELRAIGIPTNIKLYPGLPHGFWGFFVSHSKAKVFVEDTLEGFGWLLSQRK